MDISFNTMNIYEFIQLTKENPLEWINYCEIIITPTGGVILARPSHTEVCLQYASSKEGKPIQVIKDEIQSDFCLPLEWIVDKHKLIAVWYCGYMKHSGKLNRFQRKTIQLLESNHLIDTINPYIRDATEYQKYLYRQKLKNN